MTSIYGGFWKRFAAYIIDALAATFATTLVSVLIGVVAGSGKGHEQLVSNGIALVGMWLYFAIFESSKLQATPGKLMLGMKVTDVDGGAIGFGRATGRYFGKFVSSLILFIGFMMAGWTQRRQALHDMMAGTLVMNTAEVAAAGQEGQALPPGVRPSGGGMPGWAIALICAGALVPVIGILAAIAIPAYQDYLSRSYTSMAMAEASTAKQALEEYRANHAGQWPAALGDAGIDPHLTIGPQAEATLSLRADGVLAVRFPKVLALREGSMLLVPEEDGEAVTWGCQNDGMKAKYLPPECR